MLAARVRSGLVETFHDGAVAVCDSDGALIASHGDIDRPFFIRSAAKPFQAHVSQSEGAGLSNLELAVASASQRGHPIQVAIVEAMLADSGLGPENLGCPPDWPLARDAALGLARTGVSRPERVFHNCSGKHAAFLRACLAQSWPTQSYLSADHPLQIRVRDLLSALGRHDPEPIGVDGCGAPVYRTTARALGLMYARVPRDLGDVFAAMHQYPALVGENGAGDTTIATALNAVAKIGAEGCLGVGLADQIGIGAKSWDGRSDVAVVAVIEALDQLGRLEQSQRQSLSALASPVVSGGDQVVGALEPRLSLNKT